MNEPDPFTWPEESDSCPHINPAQMEALWNTEITRSYANPNERRSTQIQELKIHMYHHESLQKIIISDEILRTIFYEWNCSIESNNPLRTDQEYKAHTTLFWLNALDMHTKNNAFKSGSYEDIKPYFYRALWLSQQD